MAGQAGLTTLLSGGDLRSIGRSNRVVAMVLDDATRLPELVAALTHGDPVVRARAADALEKISAARPAMVQPLKRRLLALASRATQIESRWHLAQIIGRLDLGRVEARRARDILQGYFAGDRSRIVRVMALQALHDLAERHPELQLAAQTMRRQAGESGEPSLAARARKLAKVALSRP